MQTLLALSEGTTQDVQELMKWVFSAGSLIVTVYFWLVRARRERVSVKIYPDNGFEGVLESGGVGLWTGRIFLANCSILPTAIIAASAELWWNGRWLTGNVVPSEGSELPWNLPPAQVFVRGLRVAFDVGSDTPRERIYANQCIRFTFVTVERCRVTEEISTVTTSALAA